VPQGYDVSVWAKDLGNTRMIAVAPDGSVYVSRRSEADIIRMVDLNADGRADGPPVVIVNRPGLHGLTIHDGLLYFMTAKEVFRAPLRPDGGIGAIETLIDDLPDAGQHLNRTLSVGPDNMLYISAGSTCNACDESSQENATILRSEFVQRSALVVSVTICDPVAHCPVLLIAAGGGPVRRGRAVQRASDGSRPLGAAPVPTSHDRISIPSGRSHRLNGSRYDRCWPESGRSP
jgi:hypothetical protein